MELPNEVAVMTLPSATLFPQALLPLYIFEPRYRKMLSDTLRADRVFSVAMQKPGRVRETPCGVAGLGLIRVSVDHQDGTSHLILQGITRIELLEPVRYKPYRVHNIRLLETPPNDGVVVAALVARIHELVEQRLKLGPFPFPFPVVKNAASAASSKSKIGPGSQHFSPKDILKYLHSLADAEQLADLVSCAMLTDAVERQTILETVQLEARLKNLIHFLMTEIRRQRKNNVT